MKKYFCIITTFIVAFIINAINCKCITISVVANAAITVVVYLMFLWINSTNKKSIAWIRAIVCASALVAVYIVSDGAIDAVADNIMILCYFILWWISVYQVKNSKSMIKKN